MRARVVGKVGTRLDNAAPRRGRPPIPGDESDATLAAMMAQGRLAALAARIEGDPAALPEVRDDGDALADEIEAGGVPAEVDVALRWRIAVVRAVIAAPPDGDAVRELYGELVDRYREQPERMAQLRALGDEIRRLEADGTLASSLVARSDRRPRRP
jgi:HPt (histidine-containing phosphotransfer) domain-containing protein